MSVTSLNTWSDVEHKFGMQDVAWRQVIYDHRLWLKKRATVVNFSMPDAHQWRYRLQEFLKKKYQLPYDTQWIVYFLNNLENVEYDGGVYSLLIPSLSDLETLYTAYQETTTLS